MTHYQDLVDELVQDTGLSYHTINIMTYELRKDSDSYSLKAFIKYQRRCQVPDDIIVGAIKQAIKSYDKI